MLTDPPSNFPDLASPVVMGILNVTPDSFYDGGKFPDLRSRLKRIEEMINEGASIIDIGGSSTRPGAAEVKPEEEWDRISPLLDSVRKNFPDICISIDTYHSSVARKAIDLGINMINDISGGIFDNKMPALIGEYNIPYVIMHIQGRPGNMQIDPFYEDVVEEITVFFEKQIKLFQAHGANHLILDPGFGFGKTLEHNYSILKNLGQFKSFGYPILAGISRKSMITKVIDVKLSHAINGTTILNTIALMNGAKILRVHDVKEAVEAIQLVEMV